MFRFVSGLWCAWVAVLVMLASCATTDDGRQRQMEIASKMFHDQIAILEPFIDQEDRVYVDMAMTVMDTVMAGGAIDFDLVMEEMEQVEQIFLSQLIEKMGDRSQAMVVVASVKLALRTAQMATVQ